MVEMELTQIIPLVSNVATALGVCIAATYYVLTLKNTQKNMIEAEKNRRATLANNMMQYFTTKQWPKDWLELLSMRWNSFEDFQKKYDSRVNPDNFALRMSFWNICEYLGYQYRSGLIDIDTIHGIAGSWISIVWGKFAPVIREYRKSDYSNEFYTDFEYLAGELTRIQEKKQGVDEVKRMRERYSISHE